MTAKTKKVVELRPGDRLTCTGHVVERVEFTKDDVIIETEIGRKTYIRKQDPSVEVVEPSKA